MHTEGPMAGRCYTTTYIPLLDLGAYTIAEAMDGWKCAGLADGSMPRTGTKEDYVAAQRAEIKAIMEAREQAKK
jgi:hypothetical protein